MRVIIPSPRRRAASTVAVHPEPVEGPAPVIVRRRSDATHPFILSLSNDPRRCILRRIRISSAEIKSLAFYAKQELPNGTAT